MVTEKNIEQARTLTMKYVLEPAVLKTLGKIKGKKILDLGCGIGNLSRALADGGAKVTAIDNQKKWIEKAESLSINYDIEYKVMDGAELSDLNSEEYDFVIMNMVFLNVPNLKKATEIIDEVSRVLVSGGSLIFSDLHPISFVNEKTDTEKRIYPKNFSYYDTGSKFKSEVMIKEGKMIFEDVHYTLESYTKMLEKANMYIHRIIEPKPINSAPKIMKKQKYPEMIIFECKLFDN